MNEWEFCKTLADKFVIDVPGSGFEGKGFFRLSYCKSPNEISKSAFAFEKAYLELQSLKK